MEKNEPIEMKNNSTITVSGFNISVLEIDTKSVSI